ncbi:hypothetical protein A5788_15450 [Gordonia sp. 852002-50816_SCH5313054-c]|nr:hypothetical protein A5788_15450 [Gordonia sp. 852002-50816_SCH5313054-c]
MLVCPQGVEFVREDLLDACAAVGVGDEDRPYARAGLSRRLRFGCRTARGLLEDGRPRHSRRR